MNDNYTYDDPDSKYTDRKTGLLKNLLSIVNFEQLQDAESSITSIQSAILEQKPFLITQFRDIQKIHKFLFREIYQWAGELRQVGIRKEGRRFAEISEFPEKTKAINRLIARFGTIDKTNKPLLSKCLANLLDELNNFHPFREGNGRTQRLAMTLLAKEKGCLLNLQPPDDCHIYEQYMKGTIEGDLSLLATLINDNMQQIMQKEARNQPNATTKRNDTDPRWG